MGKLFIATEGLRRIDAYELALCLRINRIARSLPVRGFFRVISRAGNGLAWYTLLVLLPAVYGRAGVLPALHIGVTALAGVALYLFLKRHLVRDRPYFVHSGIDCGAPPLDRYSFPSGHTLHALSFTTMTWHYFPELAWVLVPFAVLIALSRVVLGLHYPSDVAAGALLGYLLARVSLALVF